jgi:hypothetical protein
MIKLFENIKKKFEIGDYVKIIGEDAWNRDSTDIFQVADIDNDIHGNEPTYYFLLDIYGHDMDWYTFNKLKLASDFEVSSLKYNL